MGGRHCFHCACPTHFQYIWVQETQQCLSCVFIDTSPQHKESPTASPLREAVTFDSIAWACNHLICISLKVNHPVQNPKFNKNQSCKERCIHHNFPHRKGLRNNKANYFFTQCACSVYLLMWSESARGNTKSARSSSRRLQPLRLSHCPRQKRTQTEFCSYFHV